MIWTWLALIGLFCGFISGLFGIGGGIVFVPFFIFALKFDIPTAIGSSLFIIVPTAFAGALHHYRLGNIQFGRLSWIILGSIVGAWIGSQLVYHIPQKTLQQVYGLFLLLVAVKLLVGK